VRQGDLVDAKVDVIVNPANSKLCHGGGAARAISVAAGEELDDECNEYLRQFGSLRVGRAMHTSAGNLRPRIKHVIHAVGPEAHENASVSHHLRGGGRQKPQQGLREWTSSGANYKSIFS